MKTYQRTTALPEHTKQSRATSVKFRDGMIVTADDLDAAQRYPVSLLHTVLRAYLGCGVVCGLRLRVKPSPGNERPVWVVCVDPGVAIDCQGAPIELCAPVELDLSPDPCDCDSPPEQVYVLIQRITSEEAPRDACSCDTDAPQFDCRRVREHVKVKAISKEDLETLPDCVCRRPLKKPQNGKQEEHDVPQNSEPEKDVTSSGEVSPEDVCAELTRCPECTCGTSWILLGSVKLNQDKGITHSPDMTERRWVKPIEVFCSDVDGRIARLEKKVTELAPTAPGQATKPSGPNP